MSKILTTIKPINWKENRVKAIEKYVDIVYQTNCRYINFNFKHLDYKNEKELELDISELKKYFLLKGMSVIITHASYVDDFYFNEEKECLFKLEKLIIDAIKYSKLLGAKIVVYHAGIAYKNGVYNEELTIKENIKFALKLSKIALKYDIKLAIENNVSFNNSNYGEVVEPSPKILNEVCEKVNIQSGNKVLGICYDIGHINLTNYDIYENLEHCKNNLFTLHLHNNYGFKEIGDNVWNNDLHNPIEIGNIDIVNFAKKLKICFNGDVVIESKYRDKDNLKILIENDYNLLNNLLNK